LIPGVAGDSDFLKYLVRYLSYSWYYSGSGLNSLYADAKKLEHFEYSSLFLFC